VSRLAVARTPPSRISGQRVLVDLRLASRKGDRAALTLALDRMRTLAHSPRYCERNLALLRNPLARLVDLLVIKQGERIANQKGWKLPRAGAASSADGKPAKPRKKSPAAGRRRGPPASTTQPSLFE
jgi:hypothetical protein